MTRLPLRLNIGSGKRRLAGFLNVDNNPNAEAVDVVHDLDRFPWPFEESSVEEVVMDHVLEHLEDTIRVIRELYRICRHDALLRIMTPHFSCAWGHPGHKRAVGIGLFDHFDPEHEERYGDCHFRVESVRLHWMRPRDRTSRARRIVAGGLDALANWNPSFCQRIWCYWVGGFEEVAFRVRVLKEGAVPGGREGGGP